MTCKCYLLPGNADNQTVPGKKELVLIFILGTDSDISPRIPAGYKREGHFPPVHTLGADFVDTTGATVSPVGELHLNTCVPIGPEDRQVVTICTYATTSVLINIHLLDSACSLQLCLAITD